MRLEIDAEAGRAADQRHDDGMKARRHDAVDPGQLREIVLDRQGRDDLDARSLRGAGEFRRDGLGDRPVRFDLDENPQSGTR